MRRVSKKTARLVKSQKELAEKMGVTSSCVSTMLAGKAKLPLARFLQIMYHLNPDQDEVNDIFNIYLENLNIPHNALQLRHRDHLTAGSSGSLSGDKKIEKILEEIMFADIPDEIKVKVYQIIKKTTDKENPPAATEPPVEQ